MMLGSAESEDSELTKCEIFLKNSNICDQDTTKSQMDGRTDDLP